MRKVFPRPKYLIVTACFVTLLCFAFLRSTYREKGPDNPDFFSVLPPVLYRYVDRAQQAQPPPQQQQQPPPPGDEADRLACQSPQIPVNASALMVKFKPHAPIDCGPEPDWVYAHAGRIHFRGDLASKHAGFQCEMTPVRRDTDFKVKLEAKVALKENGTAMPSEGVFVDCSDSKGKKFKVRLLGWGVLIYKSVSDLNVTIVQPRILNIQGRIIFIWSNFFIIYFAHIKTSSLVS